MKHLDIIWTNQFKKDYKLAMKRHLDIELLDDVIRKLASGQQLPDKNKDHALTGNWEGHRECHIQPNWLLIYRIEILKSRIFFHPCWSVLYNRT
jgi:mRNA interferase YafQ